MKHIAIFLATVLLALPLVVSAEEKLKGPTPGNVVDSAADPDLFPISGGGSSSSSSSKNPDSFYGGIKAVGDLAQTNKLAPAKSTKEILQTITKWLLSLVGTIAVISLLYGGFLYITSQGEEDKAEQAKNIILYSVIGIIIIGISAIIVNVVISVATS